MTYVRGEALKRAQARRTAALAQLESIRSEYQETTRANREADEAIAEAARLKHQIMSDRPTQYGGREGLRRAVAEAAGHGRPKRGG